MTHDRSFTVSRFANRNGVSSWRVSGYLAGVRIRKNFPTREEAAAEKSALDLRALQSAAGGVRAATTFLSDDQLREAEAAFRRLTAAPNELVASVHNRMPVILTAETMPRWLGSEPLPEEEYRALTQPLPAAQMQEREVSRYVSNSHHEGPACHAPPEAPPPELALG